MLHIREYMKMFDRPDGKRLLQKALTSGATSGGPLIAEFLETVITNELVRLTPELAVPEYKYDPQSVHSFNRLTALPSPGSAMGENSTTPGRQSAMDRATVSLKVAKRKGSVTGFLRAAAKRDYEALEVEIENHLQAFANDLVTYILYGNKDADAYTFDGLDKFISTNRINKTRGGFVPTDFSDLNALIDGSRSKKSQSHRLCFVMSPFMLTKFSSLYTQVRDQRSAIREGTNTIEIDGGHRLQTYNDIPIIESSQTRPIGKMGAVTYADAGSGGGIADDQRFFQVAPVTWDGEQEASAEVNGTSVNADTITLSWSAYDGAMFYKIYASDSTGQEVLVKVISAFTYDGNGTPTATVTSCTFTSEPLTPDSSSVPTHIQSDVPLVATASVRPEYVYLWDLHPHQGLGKIVYTNDDANRLNGIASILPLAKVEDRDDFLIKSYLALVDSFEATSGVIRGLRVS